MQFGIERRPDDFVIACGNWPLAYQVLRAGIVFVHPMARIADSPDGIIRADPFPCKLTVEMHLVAKDGNYQSRDNGENRDNDADCPVLLGFDRAEPLLDLASRHLIAVSVLHRRSPFVG